MLNLIDFRNSDLVENFLFMLDAVKLDTTRSTFEHN